MTGGHCVVGSPAMTAGNKSRGDVRSVVCEMRATQSLATLIGEEDQQRAHSTEGLHMCSWNLKEVVIVRLQSVCVFVNAAFLP